MEKRTTKKPDSRKGFRADHPFNLFLLLLANLMLVNILTLLLCIPVFTAGASFTAMSDVLMRIAEGDDSGVAKAFFKAFREDFHDATTLYVLYLPVLVADLAYIALVVTGSIRAIPVLFYILAALSAVMVVSAAYSAALVARYRNRMFTTFRNSMLLVFGYLPRSLMIFAAFGITGALVYTGWPYSGSLAVLFGFSVPGYISVKQILPIFREQEEKRR